MSPMWPDSTRFEVENHRDAMHPIAEPAFSRWMSKEFGLDALTGGQFVRQSFGASLAMDTDYHLPPQPSLPTHKGIPHDSTHCARPSAPCDRRHGAAPELSSSARRSRIRLRIRR